MAQSKPTKIVSKKHLARLERERRQGRAIIYGSVVILAIIFLSIAYGALNETLFLNFKNIVTVNGEEVTIREFQSRAKSTREQLIDQYLYYYQMAMMFGMDPSTDPQLSQTFKDIENQLDYPENLANRVLTNIEDDLLIRQFADANGITVSEVEIEAAIQNTYKYYPEGTQTLTPTASPVIFSTLSAEQLDLVTATPTVTNTHTPTQGPTFTPTAPATAAPTSTPEPTATPVTAEGYKGLYSDALGHYKLSGFNEEMFRRIYFENALYREKVKAFVTASVAHSVEKVWARHILVASETTANTVYKLLMAGGDFGTLAAAYSTDSSASAGGDLGWFPKGQMVAEFEEVAFSQEIGVISQPVASQMGFHIIQVLGHEDRPMTAEEYTTAVDDAFKVWLADQYSNAEIKVIPNYLSYVPDKPTLRDTFMDIFSTQTAIAPTTQAEQKTEEARLALTPSATPLPPTPTSTP